MKLEEMAILEDAVNAIQAVNEQLQRIEKDIWSIYNKIDSIDKVIGTKKEGD